MPAVTGAASLTRADVEALTVAHLEAADTHWTNSASQWEETFEGLHHRTSNTQWDGKAADAALERAWSDVVKVRGAADCLHSAASAARHGAGDLTWAKTQVTETIEEAEEAGFTVGQDFSVTDSTSLLMRQTAARQAQQQAFAADIAEKVQTLARIDAEVAGKITTALAPLEGLTFHENRDGQGHDGTTETVDFKTDKPADGGTTSPLPPPLTPGPNDEDWRHDGDQSLPSQMSAGLKQKLVAAAMLEMERNNEPVSAEMLAHYLDNSGTPKELSSELIDSWLSNDTTNYADATAPALQIHRNLNDVAQQAYERAKTSGSPVTATGNTPWATVAGSDGDSVRTLGHYSVSTAYSVTMNPDGTYSATYRNDVYDWYNFSTHPYSGATEYISTKAHELQAAGVAQDFLVTGSGSTQSVNGRVN